jgi:hypothetical protein
MKKLLIVATVIAWAGIAWAQSATTVVKAEQVTWKDHPRLSRCPPRHLSR